MGASHKKGEVILREPGGTFSPQRSAAGRLTRRFDLRYFKAAKKALSPERFEKIIAGLAEIALSDDEPSNRIAAAQAILRTFLPKDWHAQWAAALEEETEATGASDARPTPTLLEAVEAAVIQARGKRTG